MSGQMQPVRLPNGQRVQVPADWSVGQIEQWAASQQQSGKDIGIRPPAASPTVAKAPTAPKKETPSSELGWGDWLAEQAPMVGGIVGGLGAAALELGSLGVGTPAAVAMPAAGAAIGAGIRDYRRAMRKDARAPKTPGELVGHMAGEGLMEGAMSAVLPGVGKAASKLAPGLRRWAEEAAVKAIRPSAASVLKMPGSSLPGGAAKNLRDIGRYLVDNDISTSIKGFTKNQSIIDGADAAMARIADASKAAQRTTFPLDDAFGLPSNPAIKKWVDDNILNVSDPSAAVKLLQAQTANEEAGNLVRQVGRRTVPRALDASELRTILQNDARDLGPVWGQRPPKEKDLLKAIYQGKREGLSRITAGLRESVPGTRLVNQSFDELGDTMKLGIKAREAMTKDIVQEGITETDLPSIFLAASHPYLAGANLVYKNSGLRRGVQSWRGRKVYEPLGKKAASLARGIADPTKRQAADTVRRLGEAALRNAAESPQEEGDFDALYEEYLRQMQGE